MNASCEQRITARPVASRHPRRAFDVLLIAAFAGALLAPLADECVRPAAARGPEIENRSAQPRPAPPRDLASLVAWPDAFEQYHRDAFGLRDVLIRWHGLEKIFLLGVSPAPNLVLGRERWMFFTGEQSLETWRGLNPLDAAELERWSTALLAQQRWFAQRGIVSVFVIGPNKETIYPEFLPRGQNRVGPTRLEQLLEHMRGADELALFDLRPALVAAKDDAREPLYAPFGTHWSGRGNHVAYSALFSALAARIPRALAPLPLAQMEQHATYDRADNWAWTMRMARTLPQILTMYKPRASRVRVPANAASDIETVVFEHEDRSLPRAVLFHDSYGHGIRHLFAEHCSRLVAVPGDRLDVQLIEAERPDLVLFLYVERSLCAAPPAFEEP